MHELLVVCSFDVVGQVDEQLSETAFSRRVVTQHGRESGVAERLWQALPKGLAGTSVVAQTRMISLNSQEQLGVLLTEGSTGRHA